MGFNLKTRHVVLGLMMLLAACGAAKDTKSGTAAKGVNTATGTDKTNTQTATDTATAVATSTDTANQTSSDTSTATAAAGGALDTTFGTAGQATLPAGKAIVLGPDGTTVYLFALTSTGATINRLTPAGAVDQTFGVNGDVTGAFSLLGAVDPALYLVGQQADGKFVIVGQTMHAATAVVYALRLTSAGVPDASFGTAGIAYGPASYGASPFRLALASDGSLYFGLLGSGVGGLHTSLTAKVLATGVFDATFGSLGVSEVGALVGLQSGKILVHSADATGGNRVVKRLNADGSLDATFVTAAPTFATAVQTTGKTVELTFASDLSPSRLGVNGSLDPVFGTGGVAAAGRPIPNAGSYFPLAVAVDLDNSIYLMALAPSAPTLFKFSAEGQFDAMFGAAGAVVLPFQCQKLLVQTDKKLLCPSANGTLLARFSL